MARRLRLLLAVTLHGAATHPSGAPLRPKAPYRGWAFGTNLTNTSL